MPRPPRPSRIFLTAEWRNLIIVSYHVPAELLAPHLPPGLELDPIAGGPAVSLVAFEFRNTRVFGIPWPGFVNFPEWNLRFYVREKQSAECRVPSAEAAALPSRHSELGTPHFSPPPPRRGVVFIREFVPSRIISKIARQFYNEPYAAAPMRFAAITTPIPPNTFGAGCEVRFNGAVHELDITASVTLHIPHDSTTEHLLKEHQWGYGTTRGGKTLAYEVRHPPWRIHEHATGRVRVDWAKMYGTQWGVMQNATPFSTLLAEGSAITVSTPTPLPPSSSSCS